MPAAPSSPWHQPVTRSRTSLFLSYRDSASRPTPSTPFSRYSPYDDDDDDNDDNDDGLAGEEAGLIGRNSLRTPAIPQRGPAGDAAALPPRWVDEADHVDALVRAVKPKIAHLDKLHAKHLLPGFKDRSLEEREIQALATSITSDFRSCQSHIRRIAEQSQQLLLRHPPRPGDAETRRIDLVMAANVQTALATKVQDLSALFRKNQAEYLRQLRGNESKAVELQNRAATVYDPLVALADDEQASRSALSSAPGPPGTPSLAQQQFFSPSPAAQSSSSSHQALDARTTEIASIAQSIADLADLFKDLSSLVIDQGTLLDRVDWNVEVLGREVGAAGDELVRATRHQRRSGKCQLIFLLVLLVLACLVVLLLRPPRFASNSTSPTTSPSPATAAGGGREGLASAEEVAQAISDELGAGARRRAGLVGRGVGAGSGDGEGWAGKGWQGEGDAAQWARSGAALWRAGGGDGAAAAPAREGGGAAEALSREGRLAEEDNVHGRARRRRTRRELGGEGADTVVEPQAGASDVRTRRSRSRLPKAAADGKERERERERRRAEEAAG